MNWFRPRRQKQPGYVGLSLSEDGLGMAWVDANAAARIEYVTSLRATLAADTGADLVMNVAFDPSDAPDYAGGVTCSATAINYDFTNDPGMKGCSAAVTCSSTSGGGSMLYTITSVGTCDSTSKTVVITAR